VDRCVPLIVVAAISLLLPCDLCLLTCLDSSP
jgi:hypothetical protein